MTANLPKSISRDTCHYPRGVYCRMSSSNGGSNRWQLLGVLGLGISVAVVGIGTVWYIKRKQANDGLSVTPDHCDSNHQSPIKENKSPQQASAAAIVRY